MTINLKKYIVENQKYRSTYNDLAAILRLNYVDIVNQCGKNFGNEPDWWVSEIASRNTYSSDLYDMILQFKLARLIINENINVEKIYVISRGLQKILINYIRKNDLNILVKLDRDTPSIINIILKSVLIYFYGITRQMIYYLAVRTIIRKPKPAQTGNIILLDTFMAESSFRENNFEDRYYTGLTDHIKDNEIKKNIYYIPTLLMKNKNIFSCLWKIKDQNVNFIFKESFLYMSDYFLAFLYPFRCLRLKPLSYEIDGIDISPLLKAVWLKGLTSASSIEGLLKYKSIKRMKQAKLNIRLFIDWFENQIIDKGQNMALRKYYPTTPIIGYQGFVAADYYQCIYPTDFEYDSKILPTTVAVCGKGFIEERKEFCSRLNVEVAPAFRFQKLWQNSRESKKFPKSIIIALPYFEQESVDLICIISEVQNQNLLNDVMVYIKPHPASDLNRILKKADIKLAATWEIVSGDIYNFFSKVDILISNTSSVCAESIAMGVAVIVIGSKTGPTQNSIPKDVSSDLWKVCFEPVEVIDALKYFFKNRDVMKRKRFLEATAIRKKYFEPVTLTTVSKFLSKDAPNL
jgi:surface carbohydrate biosynthesis protein (TIGR04326 family)